MKIGLVGATGVVGEQILEQFTARSFPFGELRLFASDDSVGDFIDVAGESLPLNSLDPTSFEGLDVVVFATPAAVSCEWAAQAESKGVISLDLSSAGRLSEDRELLVAGVNETGISSIRLSTPSSLAVQLAHLLTAAKSCVAVRSVLATAVSPASSKGRAGFVELQKQSGELLNGRPAVSSVFPTQLAFNCLPSAAGEDEESLTAELKKVLAVSELEVRLNQLQLPMFYGEGAFVRLEFEEPVTTDRLLEQFAANPSLEVRVGGDYPTPLDAVGEDALQVCLTSAAGAPSQTVDLWYAADNAGFTTAGNVVRLLECLAGHLGR